MLRHKIKWPKDIYGGCIFCCNPTNLELHEEPQHGHSHYWVHCESCGANGSTENTAEEAVEIWCGVLELLRKGREWKGEVE